ncbi:MAG TPA: dihydroxyacetone kinase operon transcriptional regulator DhaR [Chloroflexota bacterium]|nr:dihydroxyacetone kinase operon transcriptional regulator DhaR [Chloroflexota bacterium]
MQPNNYPVRRDILKQFWYAFMKTAQVEPIDDYEPDPHVVRSWQRCAPRSDPRQSPRAVTLQEAALQTTLKTHADLRMQARPFLEDIYQFFEGSYCAIVFTDGAGCILDIEGDSSIVAQSHIPTTTRGRMADSHWLSSGPPAFGLHQGAIWSENCVGTNGFGMALVTAMPVQVVGAEHFYAVFHELATTAAPIHDANGRIVSLIGIVELATAQSRHSLSLVMAAARAISNLLQANMYLQEANHRLAEVNTILGSIQEGVLAWDAAGKINHVNARAGEFLHINPQTAVGLPLSAVLTLPSPIDIAVMEASEMSDIEVTFDIPGREMVQALVSLRILGNGRAAPAGYMLMVRPMEQVRRLVQQQVGARAALKLDDIPAQTAAMRAVMRQARTAARGRAPVLLRGESGVGKNHLARAIHNDSQRADRPFMTIQCKAIPHELMVAELLGSEADGRPSKFELTDGGTLMLNQIESLSLEMQFALLQVIETGLVMRLGGARFIPVDVRIIATTGANLERLVAEDDFLPNLYYRFGVFNITVPPLRERPDDIPALASRFLSRFTRTNGGRARITDEAMQTICRYPWPGNVRELESTLERALHHSDNDVIGVADLSATIRKGRVVTAASPHAQPILSVEEAEREAILQAGWVCQGRVSEMSQHLGIGRTTLWRKMKQLNLTPDYFKQVNYRN